jgi:hypothetical protein
MRTNAGWKSKNTDGEENEEAQNSFTSHTYI